MPDRPQSGELAIAKERQRQAKARHTQAKDEARQRLAYERQRAALRAQVLAALAELQAAEIELAAVQQTLARRRERRPLQQRRVAAGVEPRDTLWALDDEITGLEKQERLLSSQLEQQRLAVALLAGKAWQQALGLLRQTDSRTSKGLRQQGTWHGYGGQRPPRASHGGCQQPRAA